LYRYIKFKMIQWLKLCRALGLALSFFFYQDKTLIFSSSVIYHRRGVDLWCVDWELSRSFLKFFQISASRPAWRKFFDFRKHFWVDENRNTGKKELCPVKQLGSLRLRIRQMATKNQLELSAEWSIFWTFQRKASDFSSNLECGDLVDPSVVHGACSFGG